MNAVAQPLSDERRPWLGLASFTEATRGVFFGRQEEVRELQRRVQRKLLTILFGKSGLGKTSILQAGLVPHLRAAGYFPVYLRIDYGRDSPEPSEQIKRAIDRAVAGHWTHSEGVAPGESIWEFLHHRDAVLKDAAGATLIPLLIFDQFEELFTLAQSDEFGRARAARFIEELSDLVENRPPQALERKFEADEQAAERFDFSRSDYRVVVALREDYLAPLESLKSSMPSLAQNRLRLAPMTGSQALEAVLRPGGDLVSEEVAAAIVRFVAGGSELANAEVEPSLLSLICRELNEQRIAQQRAAISLDLLAGSHESILSNFYERSLADQPAAVRRIIEDELLTDSGYRENLAEERVLRRFDAAGAAPEALAVLVNRRLLRIEERLDVRRVELTHDVLTGVVRASRDQRHEREAREAAQRALTQQREREQLTRRALRRARLIATGCTVLAVAAVGAAALAFVNVERARRAEADAQQTRFLSEQGRAQAQRLLGFLSDDFVRELVSFGRYQVIVDLSQREIDYFHSLPLGLRDAQTVRNGALALQNQAQALAFLGDSDNAARSATEGVAALEGLRGHGDRSDATAIALGHGYALRGQILALHSLNAQGHEDSQRALDLLHPLVARPDSAAEARRAYVDALTWRAAQDTYSSQFPAAIREAREALELTVQLGARRNVDVTMDARYVAASIWLVESLGGLARFEEADQAAAAALNLANQVLAQRPQYADVLLARQNIEISRAQAADDELDLTSALEFAQRGTQDALALVKFEPSNQLYLSDLLNAYLADQNNLVALGRMAEAMSYSRKIIEEFAQGQAGKGSVIDLLIALQEIAAWQTQSGGKAVASHTLQQGNALLAKVLAGSMADSYLEALLNGEQKMQLAESLYVHDDFDGARRAARDGLTKLQAAQPSGMYQITMQHYFAFQLGELEGRADYRLGNFEAAVQAQRAARRAQLGFASHDVYDQRVVSQVAVQLSMALCKTGRSREAATLIEPYVAFYRGLQRKNRGDVWLPLEVAGALYALALAEPARAAPLLREAAQLVEHLAPVLAATHDAREWRERIRADRGS